ncbi:MAG: hypothetical protein QOE55_8312 [Acidobacteriaceae bacterium]|nr:hypothetical protein [Acidobacteriaceae bacterium]
MRRERPLQTSMDDAVWNHAVFSKNRDRLLTSEVAQRFFAEVNRQGKKFMSDEHFTVDGTLIQAWALQKSFRSKDDSDDDDGANFHGQKRSNKTHESTTDRDARLYKKSYGKESKLSYRQVARSGESRFAVRLQLRRSQPAAPPRNSNSYHQTLPR